MKNNVNNCSGCDILTHYPTRNGKRYFAAASTGEEADGKVPTLKEAAARWGEQPREIEDMLQHGDVTDLGRLNWANTDLSSYAGTQKEQLTADQQRRLSEAVSKQYEKSRQVQKIVDEGINEQPSLIMSASEVLTSYRSFQAALACLAVVLREREAAIVSAERANAILPLCADQKQREAVVTIYTDRRQQYLQYDTERGLFRVDDEAAYQDAVREAKETEAYLSAVKSNVIVAVEEVNASEFKYLPISGRVTIENAVTEKYARFLVKDTKYFRSSLNQAKEAGKQITAEMEKWALIPDFYEIKPYEPLLINSRKRLNYSLEAKRKRLQK